MAGSMTEERITVVNAHGAGSWRGCGIDGAVTLFVEAAELVVRPDALDEELATPLDRLSGAAWRAGTLTLHGDDETLQLSGAEQLDRAWVAITRRACVLPEVTRGLRALGVRGLGTDSALHARYFAPLLQARRRLERDEPLDERVAAFDAAALATRLRSELASLAAERHPTRAPWRRATEAELIDAADPVLRRLDVMAALSLAVREAPEHERFVAWRRWGRELRALFVDADRCWSAVREAATRE